ncbi:MAG: phosphoglycerate kinase [Candidatus Neomarinimicrobiota bacterium]|nr:MAG: phosphoglycerate kinase [Candidatus Neomarinimicrobiota bacterium]
MARLTIDDLKVEGKRVLVRVDFNVPLDENQNITDDFRIRAALPTIRKLLNDGAKVILMSHLGRPKGKKIAELSLKPVAERLKKYLNNKVFFATDCVGVEVKNLANSLQNSEVLLLENLRFHAEERKNDPGFASKLAELADIYVNDAFGTSHRAHASTAGIAEYISQRAAGYLLEKELHYLKDYLDNPEKPYTAVLGGAKVSGKIEIIEKLFGKVQNILIGGGMAYTFLKAKGYEIGKSLLEEDKIDLALNILKKAKEYDCTIYLPTDIVVVPEISDQAVSELVLIGNIPPDRIGVDIGPETTMIYSGIIDLSKTVLWNGPLGVFEIARFSIGTESIARKLAEVTERGTVTVIGGGDSAAAMKKFGLMNNVTHISTGGGASLELLSGMELIPITLITRK